MSAGIARVHGTAALPSQRPSALSFFNLSIAGDVRAESTLTNGVFDQAFRIALDNFATVGMIGYPQLVNGFTVVNFAIENTGLDALSPSTLGTGSAETSYGTWATTQAAMTAAVQALGTTTSALGTTVNASTATVNYGVVTVSTTNSVYGI